jgi:hypothetical protein
MKHLKTIAIGTLVLLLAADLLVRLERPAGGQVRDPVIGFSVVSYTTKSTYAPAIVHLRAYALTQSNRIYESDLSNRLERMFSLGTGTAKLFDVLVGRKISGSTECSDWQLVQTMAEALQTEREILGQ